MICKTDSLIENEGVIQVAHHQKKKALSLFEKQPGASSELAIDLNMCLTYVQFFPLCNPLIPNLCATCLNSYTLNTTNNND